MTRFIVRKTIVASLIHFLFVSSVMGSYNKTPDFGALILGFLWITGLVYSAAHYFNVFEKHLNSMLKVSVISYLALGRGTLGLICLVAFILFYLFFGWLYGLYLLAFDVIITVRLVRQQRKEQRMI